jgi:hypothetical protein
VRLWATNQRSSTATLSLPSNVCAVRFSPTSTAIVAGCAGDCFICIFVERTIVTLAVSLQVLAVQFADAEDANLYLYDVRRHDKPVAVLSSHSKTVTYTRFVDAETLLSSYVEIIFIFRYLCAESELILAGAWTEQL